MLKHLCMSRSLIPRLPNEPINLIAWPNHLIELVVGAHTRACIQSGVKRPGLPVGMYMSYLGCTQVLLCGILGEVLQGVRVCFGMLTSPFNHAD